MFACPCSAEKNNPDAAAVTRQVSHNVAALSAARTFDSLYVQQLGRVIHRANLHDDETEFFNQTDYYSPDNVREVRRPWNG